MMYGDGHAGGGWVVAMGVVMIVFWGSIVVLLAVGVRAIFDRLPHPAPVRPSPRDVLEERLARGELDPDEFEQQRELLAGRP